jgi:hypothetical protein
LQARAVTHEQGDDDAASDDDGEGNHRAHDYADHDGNDDDSADDHDDVDNDADHDGSAADDHRSTADHADDDGSPSLMSDPARSGKPGVPGSPTAGRRQAARFLPSIFDHHSSSSTSVAATFGPLGHRGKVTRRCFVSSSSTAVRKV